MSTMMVNITFKCGKLKHTIDRFKSAQKETSMDWIIKLHFVLYEISIKGRDKDDSHT